VGDGPEQFLVDRNFQGTLLGDRNGANKGIYIRSTGAIYHAPHYGRPPDHGYLVRLHRCN
ncbi:MAG: hypothetical protein AAFN70_13040, partial [Planctomycetota bacterium]